MSASKPPEALDPDLRDLRAAEFVLGTLDLPEHAAVQAQLGHDEDLRTRVYAWQDRLLPLVHPVPAIEPDAKLWQGISDSLPGHRARQSANDAAFHRLRRWQWFGVAASLSCLVLAGSLWWPRTVTTEAPRFFVVLQAPDKSNGWVVEGRVGEGVKLVPVSASGPLPAGKAMQFWTKPVGAPKPTSLGLVRVGESIAVPVQQLPELSDQQLFELTLEPETGSPTGKPTGPILFVGRAVRL